MDIHDTQTMSPSDNNQNSSSGQKIYPMTKEMYDDPIDMDDLLIRTKKRKNLNREQDNNQDFSNGQKIYPMTKEMYDDPIDMDMVMELVEQKQQNKGK